MFNHIKISLLSLRYHHQYSNMYKEIRYSLYTGDLRGINAYNINI